jgi:hypothetical protein
MPFPSAARPLCLLERMAEWSVPYIMQKGCDDGGLCSLMVRLAKLSSDYLHELASGLKNPDAVREPCVRSPWKNELAKSKLLYPAQALELGCVQERPGKLVEGIALPENDQPVDRIAYTLRLCHSELFWHASCAPSH